MQCYAERGSLFVAKKQLQSKIVANNFHIIKKYILISIAFLRSAFFYQAAAEAQRKGFRTDKLNPQGGPEGVHRYAER